MADAHLLQVPAATESEAYLQKIQLFAASGSTLSHTNLCVGQRRAGKVRDVYTLHQEDKVIILTTDRLSAFDRVLCKVPFKGAVLNSLASWWFSRTSHIVPNHVVDVPHPNVTIATKTKPLPIEFVVRGFVTGSTSTSVWTHYKSGVREYCGNLLPDNLRKNDKIEAIITPTTKDEDHDRPISPKEIIKEGILTEEVWEQCKGYALKLFAYGQSIAEEHGLILVDTKYEFGVASDGKILLIDEIHTPDSSRYWIKATYEQRHEAELEPESIDKEFIRLWYRQHCDPYVDPVLPEAPPDLVAELSRRYILLYELITGQPFEFPEGPESIQPSIVAALRTTFPSIGRGRAVVIADGPAAAEASRSSAGQAASKGADVLPTPEAHANAIAEALSHQGVASEVAVIRPSAANAPGSVARLLNKLRSLKFGTLFGDGSEREVNQITGSGPESLNGDDDAVPQTPVEPDEDELPSSASQFGGFAADAAARGLPAPALPTLQEDAGMLTGEGVVVPRDIHGKPLKPIHERTIPTVVIVADAPGSGTLASIVACNTKWPVIACPTPAGTGSRWDTLLSVYSTLSSANVITTTSAPQAALSAQRILHIAGVSPTELGL